MLLFAWTSPGTQSNRTKAATQLSFIVAKELTVLFVGAEDELLHFVFRVYSLLVMFSFA